MLLSPIAALSAVPAQSLQSAKAAQTSVQSGGPKVHTSKARDTTDCTARTQGGKRTVAGLGVGALLGSKVSKGSTGIVAGAAAAGYAGEMLDRKERCGPDADIESNAAESSAPKKKKRFGLGNILR